MSDKKSFDYTYSASAHNEILNIRKKYGLDDNQVAENQSAKNDAEILSELRKLDASTNRPGVIAGLTLGIIGSLIMGIGMSAAMVMTDRWFVQGIIIGIAGLAIAMTAHPAYKMLIKKKRERNAKKIKELSDILLDKEK